MSAIMKEKEEGEKRTPFIAALLKKKKEAGLPSILRG